MGYGDLFSVLGTSIITFSVKVLWGCADEEPCIVQPKSGVPKVAVDPSIFPLLCNSILNVE
eukprot:6474143-Amphidinium_carterae.1